MLILKHVEHEIKGAGELEGLIEHLRDTTSKVEGVSFKDIYFANDKNKFVLFIECRSEDDYLKWREICPPPPGARDWHEVLLNKDEYLSLY